MRKTPSLRAVVNVLMEDARTQPLVMHTAAVYRMAGRTIQDIRPDALAIELTATGLGDEFCCVYAATTFTPNNSLEFNADDFIFFGVDINVDSLRRTLDDISLDPYSGLGDLDAGTYPEYVKDWCRQRGIAL